MPLLITHRMRGFDTIESSLNGFSNALASPFHGAEFDTRFSKDRSIHLHHDPDLLRFNGKQIMISNCTSKQLASQLHPITNKPIPSLREVLAFAASHTRTDFFLCIDIKELSQEAPIASLIKEYGLAERVIIFSWLPQALVSMHRLLPRVPLYFSYYPVSGSFSLMVMKAKVQFEKSMGRLLQKPNTFSRLMPIFNAPEIPFYDNPESSIGFETEYYSICLPQGEFGDVLRSSQGGVCVNYRLINENYGKSSRQAGFKLCCYGIQDNSVIKKIGNIQPDVILTDDPDLTKCNAPLLN